MSRTKKDKPTRLGGNYNYNISKQLKFLSRHKRKTYKNTEINNGEVLDRMKADRWDVD